MDKSIMLCLEYLVLVNKTKVNNTEYFLNYQNIRSLVKQNIGQIIREKVIIGKKRNNYHWAKRQRERETFGH